MPAKLQRVSAAVQDRLSLLGSEIRNHRKQLKISAVSTAEAAGLSRVTLYRIEKGEPSVSIAAYLSVIAVLGMEISLQPLQEGTQQRSSRSGWIPARVVASDYPQLNQLAWQLSERSELTPAEALTIYERNERHIDLQTLDPEEHDLIEALRLAFRKGQGLV